MSARPTSVTAIAVLDFVLAGLALLGTIVNVIALEAVISYFQSIAIALQLDVSPSSVQALAVAYLLAGIGSVALNGALGWGMWTLRNWARILQLVLAGFWLLSIPIGTVAGALVLYYLTRSHVEAGFTSRWVSEDNGSLSMEKTVREISPPPRRTVSDEHARVLRTELAEEPNRAMAWLAVTSGPRRGRQFGLTEGRNTIGRDGTRCDIILDDGKVSAEHARVRWENGRFVIHDLASRNGTFVNRQRVDRQSLLDGDEIRLGGTTLVFKEAR